MSKELSEAEIDVQFAKHLNRIEDLHHQSAEVSAIGESFEGEAAQIDVLLTEEYRLLNLLQKQTGDWETLPY